MSGRSEASAAAAPEIRVGCLYAYTDRSGVVKVVPVVSIDRTLDPPSYTILVDGANRETEADRLSCRLPAGAEGQDTQPRIPIPDSFRCPISGALMREPVVDPEGNTFDREGIERWLARNPTSPLTRSPLTAGQLKPNRALADSLEAFKPLLEQEEDGEAAGAPHSAVVRALKEEEAFQDGSMWIGRLTVQVVRATDLPKADAIVVASNGGSHLLELPDKPEDVAFKMATLAVAGKDPTWDHEMQFPVAARVGQEDGRAITFNVKHLPVGQKWTGNNEGEWLGKVTVNLTQVVGSGSQQAQQLQLPVLKKGAPVGAAKLHVVLRCEAVPFAVFAEEVSRKAATARTAPPKNEVDDVVGMLKAGLEFTKYVASGQSDPTGRTEMRLGQDIGRGVRSIVGGPDVLNEQGGWSREQIYTEEQLAEQRRVYDDALPGGVFAARLAAEALRERQLEANKAARAARGDNA